MGLISPHPLYASAGPRDPEAPSFPRVRNPRPETPSMGRRLQGSRTASVEGELDTESVPRLDAALGHDPTDRIAAVDVRAAGSADRGAVVIGRRALQRPVSTENRAEGLGRFGADGIPGLLAAERIARAEGRHALRVVAARGALGGAAGTQGGAGRLSQSDAAGVPRSAAAERVDCADQFATAEIRAAGFARRQAVVLRRWAGFAEAERIRGADTDLIPRKGAAERIDQADDRAAGLALAAGPAHRHAVVIGLGTLRSSRAGTP